MYRILIDWRNIDTWRQNLWLISLICLIQSFKYLTHAPMIWTYLAFLWNTFWWRSNIQYTHILLIIDHLWLWILNLLWLIFLSSDRAVWNMIVLSFFRYRAFFKLKFLNIKCLTSFYHQMWLSFILLIWEHLFLTCRNVDALLNLLHFLLKTFWAWCKNCRFSTF